MVSFFDMVQFAFNWQSDIIIKCVLVYIILVTILTNGIAARCKILVTVWI